MRVCLKQQLQLKCGGNIVFKELLACDFFATKDTTTQSPTHGNNRGASEIYLFTNELKRSDSKQCQQRRLTAIQNLERQLNFGGNELTEVQRSKNAASKRACEYVCVHVCSERRRCTLSVYATFYRQFVEFWHFIEISYCQQQKQRTFAVFVVSQVVCMPFFLVCPVLRML